MTEKKQKFQVEIASSSRFKKWSDFLFLQEGRKRRLSEKVLSGCAFIVFIGIFALQFVNVMTPDSVANIESKIGIPVITGVVASQNLPTYSKVSDFQSVNTEKAKAASKGRKPVTPRLNAISLDGKVKIPTGAEVQAILISGGANGNLKARTTENLTVDGEIVVPSGATLFGKGSSSEERLYVEFSKINWPGAKDLRIKAQAYDQSDKIIGLKGKKVGDYVFKIALSSGLIFLGGLAEGLQDEAPSLSFEPRRKSIRDAALNGVASATAQQGREVLNRMNNQSQVEVQHSTPVLVIFEEGEVRDSK